jgi:hypothetical protein
MATLKVTVGVSDLRAEPRFRSERVDQVIFGERVRMIDQGKEGYAHVLAPDGYDAYISKFGLGRGNGKPEWKVVKTWKGGDMLLPVGSLLTADDIGRLGITRNYFRPSGYTVDKIEFAKRYLGVPYLWGGVTELGIDCSGLAQRVFGFNGINLPRNADEQEKLGTSVQSLREAEPEDLIFFPGHVGIHMGDGMLIHANLHNQRVSVTDLNGRDSYSRYLKRSITSIKRIRV